MPNSLRKPVKSEVAGVVQGVFLTQVFDGDDGGHVYISTNESR